MDELKRQRRILRRDFNASIRELEGLLRETPLKEDVITVSFKLFSDTHEELAVVDIKVMDHLMSEEATEEAQDKEADEIRDYKRRYETVRVLKEKLLPTVVAQAMVTGSESVTGPNMEMKLRNFKLHPMKPKQFSSEIKDWLSWWAQFQKIDEEPHMTGSDKFWYLLDSLKPGTDAYEIATGYPQSNENYPIVIEALKRQFGNEDMQLQVYIRELLSLVIANVKAKEKTPVKSLYLKLDSHIRALKTLKLEKADPATWLFPLVESSLPETTLDNWNRSPLSQVDGSMETPPRTRLDLLMSFLEREVEIQKKIEMSRSFGRDQAKEPRVTFHTAKNSRSEKRSIPTLQSFHVNDMRECGFCGMRIHPSSDCPLIENKTHEQIIEILRGRQRCFRCTGPHFGSDCRANLKCRVCQRRHLTILCRGQARSGTNEPPRKKTKPNTADGGPKPKPTVSSANVECTPEVALQTVNLKLMNEGHEVVVRGFIDSGSQRSYILKSTAEKLNLEPISQERVVHSLFGDQRTPIVTHNLYELEMGSCCGSYRQVVEVRDQPKICGSIPKILLSNIAVRRELSEKNIQLSDDGVTGSEIEISIGADLYASIVTGVTSRLSCGAIAIHTKLGWSLMGRVTNSNPSTIANVCLSMSIADASVTKLWELDVLGIQETEQCKERIKCSQEEIKNFETSITRLDNGRYCVKLPWKGDSVLLPVNREVAFKRLQNATKKLNEIGHFGTYAKMFLEWEQEKFIEKVPRSELSMRCHYLPHRAVVKPGSLTTPVRPVFDASCRVGKSPSLNDLLHKGENYVLHIPELILGFREKRVGFISDIRKAFQMIGVQREDCDMMRFLWWRDETMSEVEEYRHVRVIFGATCSPFILSAVLHYHLTNLPAEENEIGRRLFECLYIDNCVSSEDSKEKYEEFRRGATELISRAQMELRMWMSNVDELEDENTHTVSVLGLQWDRIRDELSVPVKRMEIPAKITKRVILSSVQKIFDPIGVTTPAVLPMKTLLQQTWLNKRKWDEELPRKEVKKFVKWCDEVVLLENIKVPRLATFGVTDRRRWSIHTFTDASKEAYSSVVYLRVDSGTDVHVQLLAAKSRVAPLKELTIPKLELMGCLIGARLTTTVKKALKLEEVAEHYWSDSTTALAWIQRENQWGTFVANRANEIRKLTNVKDWRYVPGKSNPADLPSRGCRPNELLLSRWWEGPHWLYKSGEDWFPEISAEVDEQAVVAELKKSALTPIVTFPILDGVKKQHKYELCVRIVGWVRRFLYNKIVKNPEFRRSGKLSAIEMEEAELMLVRKIQLENFPQEARRKLYSLELEEDEWGVIRVKTRLTYRDLPKDFKFPILLPGNCEAVRQLILDYHTKYEHAGAGILMTELRQRYWILKARRTINSVISKCFRCTRFSARSCVPKPAPLPLDRIKDAEVYEVVGTDAAGPLFLKNGKKVWLLIFTCAIYRAVHFELVSSMSTLAFLKVLTNFIRKYRRPAIIYSDNGTNFRGADNFFKSLDWQQITREEGVKQIEWKFSPAGCPWYGAFWERMIRTTKEFLRKSVGNKSLSYKELEAVLYSIEEVINRRPLTNVSENPDDFEPLTPAHFLHPYGSVNFPEGELSDPEKMRFRYSYVAARKQELKNRFLKEYLAMLVNRYPKKSTRGLRIGELVIVGSDNKKRLEWPLGRIVELFPGADGEIRVAKVKTQSGIIIRAIQRLHPLEMYEEKPIEEDIRKRAVTTRSGRIVKVPLRLGCSQMGLS